LVPLAGIQDNFGSSVLPCVDDAVVLFIIVGGSPEINDFDSLVKRLKPNFLFEAALSLTHFLGGGELATRAAIVRITETVDWLL
jgi:hypothetical protein